jgi:Fe-S cluster assembly scaffold protein SufB
VRTGKILKTSTSDIFIVEINVVTSIHDWIFDTGSYAHICSNMQALKKMRKLHNKEVQLRIGNRAQVAAVTVRNIKLYLPNGLIMEFENVYFISKYLKKYHFNLIFRDE